MIPENMEQIALAAVVAVVTGVITGSLSSLGTVSSLKVHIDYLRASIDKHDNRLSHVEKDVSALGAAQSAHNGDA